MKFGVPAAVRNAGELHRMIRQTALIVRHHWNGRPRRMGSVVFSIQIAGFVEGSVSFASNTRYCAALAQRIRGFYWRCVASRTGAGFLVRPSQGSLKISRPQTRTCARLPPFCVCAHVSSVRCSCRGRGGTPGVQASGESDTPRMRGLSSPKVCGNACRRRDSGAWDSGRHRQTSGPLHWWQRRR